MVVYVHGWNNNADDKDKEDKQNFDTAAFPYLLARRHFQNPNMNVIGVYVGWQGTKFKFPPAHFLTPLNRALVADAIGNGDEIRDDIVSLTNHVEQSIHSGYSPILRSRGIIYSL
ncbi:hypothetical protein M0N77_08980 [Psychrobacter sp. AH5]|uniref:hypothetical protein n=1 Tax=Psychrobacter sp. AH5 TaxID=2937433 RepID=UPI00334290FA